MKILLTGSNGFIGSNIRASGLGDNTFYCYDIIHGEDICDRRHLEYVFETERFDAVIHCAALTGVRRGEVYPTEYISTNVMGTKNVVDMCEKYHIFHLINFSSSSIYGANTENQLKETEPAHPKSIYGMSKLMAEHIVARAKIKTTTVRPFTVYGKNGRNDQVIYKWINAWKQGKKPAFYGDGDSARGYTHVEDLIEGIRLILNNKDFYLHETYNLGGDEVVSLNDLLKIFKQAIPGFEVERLPMQDGDQLFNFADTTQARKHLKWKTKKDFSKEVTNIIKYELLQ